MWDHWVALSASSCMAASHGCNDGVCKVQAAPLFLSDLDTGSLELLLSLLGLPSSEIRPFMLGAAACLPSSLLALSTALSSAEPVQYRMSHINAAELYGKLGII